MPFDKILLKRAKTFVIILLNASCCFGQTRADFTTLHKNTTRVSGLQFSPDSKSLLYALSTVDWENNRIKTDYVVYDLVAGSPRKLSFKERDVRQPAWSPSGKYLSFIAVSDTTGSPLPQIYIQEWPSGIAKCITASRSGISDVRWSPKGDQLLFLTTDTLVQKRGAERFVKAFEVGNNSYTTTEKPLSSHLHVANIRTGQTKRLTGGDWTVTNASWVSDSVILFSKASSPYSADLIYNEATLLHVPSGRTEAIASELTTLMEAKYSPINNRVAILHNKNNVPADMPELSIVGVNDRKIVNLTARFDKCIYGYEWMPDGDALVLQVVDGLKAGLTKIALNGKTEPIALGNMTEVYEHTISKTGQIAVVGNTPATLPEIYLYNPLSSGLEKITSYNGFTEQFTLGKTEGIEWPVSGGMVADGVVTYPPDFVRDKRYPLVLVIHGGPTASSTVSFDAFVQHLAAQGWIVFQPNYRGSINRGNTFQHAIANDAGFGPGEDIVKGIAVLKQKGFVDEKQIAVTGWSYGGYMTAWLIGKYPMMWKAAVAGAAPVDISDMTSLSDLNVTLRHAITSSPWKGDNYQKYYEMSPISNLSKARTPTLVMSVVGDYRVAITGSYKIYQALRANNVPVQFTAYPGSSHFPSDPVNQNDVYMRWTSWLKKYLD